MYLRKIFTFHHDVLEVIDRLSAFTITVPTEAKQCDSVGIPISDQSDYTDTKHSS